MNIQHFYGFHDSNDAKLKSHINTKIAGEFINLGGYISDNCNLATIEIMRYQVCGFEGLDEKAHR